MKKKAILALTLAGLVALQTPMVAMADTVHKHDGVPVTSADDNQDVTATGDQLAIQVDGQNCTVKKVTAENAQAIEASNGATVTADSATNNAYSETVKAEKDAKVTVNGAVENKKGYAIKAFTEATVNAGSATNNGTSQTVEATGQGTIVSIEAKEGVTGATGAVTNNGNGGAILATEGATVTAGSATNSSDLATVDANASTVEVSGPVTNNGVGKVISAKEGATVTAGSVMSKGNGVSADGENTKVTVKWNLVADGTGVTVYNGATVTAGSVISGHEGVDAHNGGTVVKVLGDVVVNGNGNAILAETGAVVTAKNASTTGDGGAVAAHAQNAGTVIVISGDATSGGIGVMAQDDGVIVVEGTVTGTGYGAATGNGGKVIAYEVKSADPAMVEYGDGVYYIIKGTDNTGISNVEGTKDETVLEKTYKTAVKDTVLKVSVESGYELKAGTIEVTKNADGTYSIKVPVGGGVTLETIKKAVEAAQAAEAEEKKATVTGSEGNAVGGGSWNCGPGNYWTYRNNGIFKDTWGYITLEDGKTGWFWFDKNGVMVTGWKEISGKWYYFNEAHDGTYGMMLVNTTTPDGKQVGADGAWIQE